MAGRRFYYYDDSKAEIARNSKEHQNIDRAGGEAENELEMSV